MTILQALERHYHRLAERGEVPAPGRSREKFGFCVVLSRDGEPVAVEDLRNLLGKKRKPTDYPVPAAVKRTVGIASNFLWDKTAYVLGRTAGNGKRTTQEHAAFREMHLTRLADETDEGLIALRLFLEKWQPDRLESVPGFVPEMLDANVMFRLDGERQRIHERPAARALVEMAVGGNEEGEDIFCLVTGERGPVERLHPTIKGVADNNPPPGGAHSLVSFNLDAFTSLGKTQGANAPTSKGAAFRYGTTLNHLLTRGGPNRLPRPIGDATVVFWAEAGDGQADALFANWLGGDAADEDASETRKLEEIHSHIERAAPRSLPRSLSLQDQGEFAIGYYHQRAARLSNDKNENLDLNELEDLQGEGGEA